MQNIMQIYNAGQPIFGFVFLYLDFLVFLYVFWCAEPENDLSFLWCQLFFT